MRRLTGTGYDHVNRPEKNMVVTSRGESRRVIGTEGAYVLWHPMPRWKKARVSSIDDWRKWAIGSTLDNAGYSAKAIVLR